MMTMQQHQKLPFLSFLVDASTTNDTAAPAAPFYFHFGYLVNDDKAAAPAAPFPFLFGCHVDNDEAAAPEAPFPFLFWLPCQ